MLIEFGNTAPHEQIGGQFVALADNPASENEGEPAVTYLRIPDDCTFDPRADVRDVALHLAQNPDVTHMPDNEALVAAVRFWPSHSAQPPAWVWSDDHDMERMLGEFYGCPAGRPDNLEDTHYTMSGPPGVGARPEA